MAVAGGSQGGGGVSGSGGDCGRSASVPGCRVQPLLPLAAPLSSPPTPLPPARLSPPPPPFYGEPISPAVSLDGGGGGVFRPHGQAKRGVVWGGLPSLPFPGGERAPWLRGEAVTSGSSSAVMLMLLSGRRNRQWDRSLPGAFPARAAGARSHHFRMGGSTAARSRCSLWHTR